MDCNQTRVLISYAWENAAYRQRVKSLAARLRANGVNARLDAWHLRGKTIPEFMASEVRNADKILFLCSPQYRARVHAMEDGQRPSGSGWETMLVGSGVWTRHLERNQIVVALFSGKWEEASPDFLAGLTYIDLTDDASFEDNYVELLRNLTDQHERAPFLGAPLELSPISTKPLRGSIQPHVVLVSNASIPKQLPPPPADFVGREFETTKLVNAVRKVGATALGVRGIGGIGKTALALAVADILASDFPVGQIYLDLKGAQHKDDSPGIRPLTAAEAMDHVIRSFNPAAPTPTNDAEREGQYRTILNGKRVLLLMDNARNAQQVERLTPPAGCLMILTAREHFTLPGIFDEDLPVLNSKDAHELLLKIAPSVGHHRIKLAKLCGYLPEALRTAASALASAPNLSASEFLHRMNSARRRLSLTGVELSLATSLELLSEKLRDRWFQLGVFPATFDEFAAAAIWQTSNSDAKNTLTSLLRYSLVQFDSKHDRYYIHDLVRDFTLSRLDESALKSARFRHSKYYSEILLGADYLSRQSDSGFSLGLEMYDAERVNIEVGQHWAATNASRGEGLARLCLRYSEAGINLMPIRLNTQGRIAWLAAGQIVFSSFPSQDLVGMWSSDPRYEY
jgi:TIR domain